MGCSFRRILTSPIVYILWALTVAAGLGGFIGVLAWAFAQAGLSGRLV